MEHPLADSSVVSLLTKVEEASRSTEAGVRRFVEPAQGTLRRATSRRPHLVFGRRGSGKTTLMRKAAQDLTVDRRPIAFINIEPFKGHSYPDVLLSVLIACFGSFKEWLQNAAIAPANKTTFWKKLFGSAPTRSPFDKKRCRELAVRLDHQVESLTRELHAAEEAQVVAAESERKAASRGRAVGLSAKGNGVSVGVGSSSRKSIDSGREVQEEFRKRKIDFLHRSVLDFQSTFRDMAKLCDGDCFLFLDDLYFIPRKDQPLVVDYFHGLSRETGVWLKIGTIRHRTEWYRAGDPPRGLKLGDDVDEIDLDLTLEQYGTAKEFLVRVLGEIAKECGVSLQAIITDGAVDRLVLASGGVARDFLGIFRRSVDFAIGRGIGHHRGEKVGVEDVNQAAGQYDNSKRQELQLDTQDDRSEIEGEFERIRDFCVGQANANCFLLNQDAKGREVELIEELVDLKLVHRIRSRVTVGGRPGDIYRAFMLDVSQYTGARKRRRFEIIPFWAKQATHRLRRVSLIYEPIG